MFADGAHQVVFNTVPAHHLYGRDYSVERRPAPFVETSLVVYLFRPVNRDSNKEAVVNEEPAPFVVYEQTVCLYAVVNIL